MRLYNEYQLSISDLLLEFCSLVDDGRYYGSLDNPIMQGVIKDVLGQYGINLSVDLGVKWEVDRASATANKVTVKVFYSNKDEWLWQRLRAVNPNFRCHTTFEDKSIPQNGLFWVAPKAVNNEQIELLQTFDRLRGDYGVFLRAGMSEEFVEQIEQAFI